MPVGSWEYLKTKLDLKKNGAGHTDDDDDTLGPLNMNLLLKSPQRIPHVSTSPRFWDQQCLNMAGLAEHRGIPMISMESMSL